MSSPPTSEHEPDVSRALHNPEHVMEVGRRTIQAAHRLDNELNIILGYAALLVEDMAEGSEHKEFAERVRLSGERLAGVLRRIVVGEALDGAAPHRDPG